jgi:hypothetical protein
MCAKDSIKICGSFNSEDLSICCHDFLYNKDLEKESFFDNNFFILEPKILLSPS